jgi:hypothetical protein
VTPSNLSNAGSMYQKDPPAKVALLNCANSLAFLGESFRELFIGSYELNRAECLILEKAVSIVSRQAYKRDSRGQWIIGVRHEWAE